MQLTYRPDGQTAKTWPVDLGKFRVPECEVIEKRTGGMEYGGAFKEALLKGSTRARRALLFVLLRREHPHTRWEDVDFADDELLLEFSIDELREMRTATADASGVPEEQRAQAVAALDAEIRRAEEARAAVVDQVDDGADDVGKALPVA